MLAVDKAMDWIGKYGVFKEGGAPSRGLTECRKNFLVAEPFGLGGMDGNGEREIFSTKKG